MNKIEKRTASFLVVLLCNLNLVEEEEVVGLSYGSATAGGHVYLVSILLNGIEGRPDIGIDLMEKIDVVSKSEAVLGSLYIQVVFIDTRTTFDAFLKDIVYF